MRITSGIYKNREIKSPQSSSTHPMGERERLALFNIISESLPGAQVLDAYAGTGALGIEALSRGAKNVVLVEKSPKVVRVIRDNLRSLGVDESSAQIICQDVNKVGFDSEFDLIFIDPPYDEFCAIEVGKLTKYLRDGGTMVLSHPGVAPEIMGLSLEKTRSYARANISIYRK
ncbi:16S rRNA (guanine(966)-N(2))-methyltransferase RsmD [Candidatus Saccharibacteria bacterium]|nr:16S rRNA (guanine(966)-N(2))-methyltransferase RsmD [Candidatus Saccharibacteria bacterium]